MAQINSLAGAVSADDVMAHLETQFSREIDGYIKVESVFPQTKLSELYVSMWNVYKCLPKQTRVQNII